MEAIASTPDGRTLLERMMYDEPMFTSIGLLMLGLAMPTLVLMGFDTRTVQGENPWIKPFKFELSIAFFLLTLAFFAKYLPEGMTEQPSYKVYSIVVIACAVIEMVWIIGAASFAIPSHFSTGPVMSRIYGVMGLLAVILTSATLVYGIAILRQDNGSAVVTAIAISLILTFVLTIFVNTGWEERRSTPAGSSTSRSTGFACRAAPRPFAKSFATAALPSCCRSSRVSRSSSFASTAIPWPT